MLASNLMPLLADSIEGPSSTAFSQFLRFWSLSDPSVRIVLAGMLLLGLSCGLLGSFVVLRKMSLLGDSLGHAVLPGVCIGFLVNQTKDVTWIFVGAISSALLGSWLIGFIQRHSRIKIDTAMGLILSGFFGLGTVLLTRLQHEPFGGQAGLDRYLFGQATGIGVQDLWLMGIASTVIVGCVVVAFQELTITSFDEGFAAAMGLPTRAIHYLLMGLTATAIVITIQAVGVVLLSAVLITPAATAYLLTDRLKPLVVLAALIGMASGAIGACVSFLQNDLPTGPVVVLVLSCVFTLAYLFSPRHGITTRLWRRWQQARTTRRENLLKSIYLTWEAAQKAPVAGIPADLTVSLADLAAFRKESSAYVSRQLPDLVRRDFATLNGNQIRLTETGRTRATELVRNYRLWEQFLSYEFQLPVDHGQAGAEEIEHVLRPELVQELERRLADEGKSP